MDWISQTLQGKMRLELYLKVCIGFGTGERKIIPDGKTV